MPRLFIDNFVTGIYLRVLQEGFIETGSPVERVKEGEFKVSIQSLFRAYFDKNYSDPKVVMEKALLIPKFSLEWKKS